ncbi:MAG: ParB N-terminal domain-containing protein [Nitrososphaeria archaeon]
MVTKLRRINSSNTKYENTFCKLGLHNGESYKFESLEAIIVEINELKEHEKIDEQYCEQLKSRIQKDGFIKKAIAVDANTRIVLDGHHRLNALRRLGCKRIPAILVDYNSPMIQVQGWNKDTVSKQAVIVAGTTPNKLPPKTTRHTVIINGLSRHISYIEKNVNIPLSELKPKNYDAMLSKFVAKK